MAETDAQRGMRRLYEWKMGRASGFVTKLFELLSICDPQNLSHMGLAFPSETLAFYRFSTEEGYWESVRKLYDPKKEDKVGP